MADVNRGDRPLSPHLTVYRAQMTSISSIFIRITGNAMIVAVLMIVWWFLAAASSPEAFARADGFLRSWFGDLVLFLSLWALWYHTLGGMRHMYWDQGGSLDVTLAEKLGLGMFVGSAILTIFTVIVI